MTNTLQTFFEYQEIAKTFRLDSSNNSAYLLYGLAAEVGEAEGKIAKFIRDGVSNWNTEEYQKELGDIMWFIANLRDYFKCSGMLNIVIDKIPEEVRVLDMNNNRMVADRNLDIYANLHKDITTLIYETKNPLFIQDILRRIWLEVAYLINLSGATVKSVLEKNIEKLAGRKQRNQIKGNGDDR